LQDNEFHQKTTSIEPGSQDRLGLTEVTGDHPILTFCWQ